MSGQFSRLIAKKIEIAYLFLELKNICDGDRVLVLFAIYNRWGEQVFFTTNSMGCWDGKHKGEMQQSGNFIYIIKAITACGKVDMKGNVLLLR